MAAQRKAIAVGCNLVTAAVDLAHEMGEALGDPAEKGKCGIDGFT
jgi:hypothetical protein